MHKRIHIRTLSKKKKAHKLCDITMNQNSRLLHTTTYQMYILFQGLTILTQ